VKNRLREKFQVQETQGWQKFWTYFVKTWLKSYDVSTWNFHGKADLDQRTNNALERHNKELKEVVGYAYR
jgi:hypothetical protein